MKTVLPITNGLALIITVFVNYFGNAGIFNGNTMATVSDRYANFFTPAGYAFSIWGIIYFALLGFVIYTGRALFTKKETDPILFKIRGLFVFTCLANSLWVIAWLNDYVGLSVIIMVALLVCLLRIILITRMELDYHPFRRYLFVFLPFALYAGWISVALIANVAAWLTKMNWDGWGISAVTWTVFMIAIAGVVNVFMIMTRNLREYGLVGIWALIAISVANNTANGSLAVVYTCYIVAFVILIFIVINAMKNRRNANRRYRTDLAKRFVI
ncbi:tryptophan-rich sensory protein [Sphingobacterium sp. DN00404]|uniref:Tryptophan-rich sensory protein n=1 Tax=Sphingobacterium micropteri TaxID=2763501 RepID=A0ABR7YQU0_9SPHI|nr:tryptophan-rich sensory protein [Sphingobacterium micropteri]MBD1433719.1 tryptophan-rich sensory protein [Sphingobacterium micropteri]